MKVSMNLSTGISLASFNIFLENRIFAISLSNLH